MADEPICARPRDSAASNPVHRRSVIPHMRALQLTVAFLLITCGCSTADTKQASVSPTVAPRSTASPAPAGRFGVFTGSNADGQGHNSVRIFTAGGRLQAHYLATIGGDEIPPAFTFGKCCAVFLPTLSLSNTSVYFPDGDRQLRALSSDGGTSIVHQLPNVRGRTRAVFAVSPDDRRIAISLFDWSLKPMQLRIYVEDLIGGSHRVEVFRSSSTYEWPVGWHQGNVVLALNPVPNASNPYGAGAYHVVNAADGTRLATMGGPDCPVVGSLSQAGTACASDCGSDTTCVDAVNWAGVRNVVYRRPNAQGSGPSWSALSPDGKSVTTGTSTDDGVATTSGVMPLASSVDLRHWWVDDRHVLGAQCVPNAATCDMWNVIDVTSGSAVTVDNPDANPIGWFPVSS